MAKAGQVWRNLGRLHHRMHEGEGCGHMTVDGQECCGYDHRGSSYLGGGLQFAKKLFLMHYLIGFSKQSCRQMGRSYHTDEETWKVEVICFRG